MFTRDPETKLINYLWDSFTDYFIKKHGYTTVSSPLGFNKWEKFLCWLLPRQYDPWWQIFMEDPPEQRGYEIDKKD